MISVYGLMRSQYRELGRYAGTGSQTSYGVELARAWAKHAGSLASLLWLQT